MFLNRNKKINVYPCKPQFNCIKVGLRGSELYRHVFVMRLRPSKATLRILPKKFSVDYSKAVPLLQLFFVCRLFILSLITPHLLSFRCFAIVAFPA